MSEIRSDALVFFGATGDLAYKKIFLSLRAMIKRGNLDVPVIGVAKANWNLKRTSGAMILAHGRDPYFPGWPDTLQINYSNLAAQEAMVG